MKEIYEIRIWQDNIYAIYYKGEYERYVYKGTIEEVNAWISLREKDLL